MEEGVSGYRICWYGGLGHEHGVTDLDTLVFSEALHYDHDIITVSQVFDSTKESDVMMCRITAAPYFPPGRTSE